LRRLPQGEVRDGRIIPIVGDATLENDLKKAQIQDADAFIAVSGQDTLNALAAQVARHIFEVPTVITRVSDPARKELYNQLGVVTISATDILTELALQATRRPPP
ncbi:MAG: NAD-binding protein, partial [Chloroflexi bacterium]|nr:NAD-binding protein [Chloroflexota bacterium]